MIFNKKGVSPIISVVLLLVISVSLIGLSYNFLSDYTQSNIEEAENKKFKFSNLEIRSVFELNNDLFLEFDLQNQNNALLQTVKLSNQICTLNSNITRGINILNLTNCGFSSLDGIVNLEIQTNIGTFQDFFLVENGSIKFTSTSYFQYWNRSGTNLYYTGGNVGIGTTNPSHQLHIRGEFPYIGFEDTNNPNSSVGTITQFQDGALYYDSNFNNVNVTNAGHYFRVNGASETVLSLLGDGNVGIGTENPLTKLDIRNGQVSIDRNQMSGGYRTWMDAGLLIGAGGSDSAYFGMKDEGSNQADTVIAWGDDDEDHLRFIHTSSGGSFNGTEQMRIQANGNVGIGTNNPGRRLVVADPSSDNVAIQLQDNDKNWFLTTTLLEGFGIYEDSTGSASARFLIESGGNVGIGTTDPQGKLHVTEAIYSGDNGANNGAFRAFTNTGSQTVNIDSNGDSYLLGGDVGIGTSNPREKLEVIGDLFVQGQDIIFSMNTSVHNVDSISYDDTTFLSSPGIYSFFADYNGKNGPPNSANAAISVRDINLRGFIRPSLYTGSQFMSFGNTDKGMKFITDQEGLAFSTDSSILLHAGDHVDDLVSEIGITSGTTTENLYLTADSNIHLITGRQVGTHPSNTKSLIFNTAGVLSTPELEVDGNARIVNGNNLRFLSASGNLRGYIQGTETDNEHLIIATSNDEDIAFKDGGVSGDSNLIIYGDGNAWLRGSLTQNSDERIKENISNISNTLEKLENIRGVTYKFKNVSEYSNRSQIGVIAQEVEAEFPELVFTNSEGIKSVEYSKLTPILIEAIKELKSQNEMLEKRISNLENNPN